MKTAISLPDQLFHAADRLANRLGVSRSELYANAVREYLVKHDVGQITERLNEVYASERSDLPPDLAEAQARSIGSSEW